MGSRRGGSALGVALAVALIGLGLLLWVPRAGDTANANTDLGTALLGGAVVAFAVLLLQQRLDARAQEIEGRRQVREDASAPGSRPRRSAPCATT